jgi:cellulose synthase/poly-beta-1,6-N-acetylglucosamine synthase-like glycosyltransferase
VSDPDHARDGSGPGACLVIIPALNEERTLGGVVAGLRAVDPAQAVLVIDDGSTDATAAVARREGARVVSHPFNLGYGAALQTGYRYAVREGYPYLVQMDADGQHAATDVQRLLEPLRSGIADVALGSRFAAGGEYDMGRVRDVGRAALRSLLKLCGGPPLTDPTSGFQAFTQAVARMCCGDFYPSDFPDIDVLLTLHRRGCRIVEVPVRMAPNPPHRMSMHGGLRSVFYSYKMLLATLRSALAPRS